MSPLVEAHLLALGLVLLDLLARTVRIRSLLALVHAPLRWRDAACLNLWSDLGAAVTPMRLGGEPARLAALRIFRVPLRPALGGLALELAIATPVTIFVGLGLALSFGGEWLASLDPSGGRLPAGIAIASVAAVAGILVLLRRGPRPLGALRRPAGASLATVALTVATTVVSLGSRVAILPVLLLGSGAEVDPGAAMLGSFLLLTGQLLVPLPAGAGVVDAAFLGGIAGGGSAGVLLAWRFYTVGFGVIAGTALLVRLGIPLRTWLGSLGRMPRGVMPEAGCDRVVAEQSVEDGAPGTTERGLPGAATKPAAERGVGQ